MSQSTKSNLIPAAVIVLGIWGAHFWSAQETKKQFQESSIHITGWSKREVKADFAIWEINFKGSSSDYKKSKAAFAKSQKEVLSFLKGLGFTEKDFTELPTESAVNHRHEKDQEFKDYEFTGRVVVKSEDVDKVAKAHKKMHELIEKGVMVVGETSKVRYWSPTLRYIVRDKEKLHEEMFEEAFKQSHAKAESAAKVMGKKIDRVKHSYAGGRAHEEFFEGPGKGKIMKKMQASVNVTYAFKD